MLELSDSPSLDERELLLKEFQPRKSGFTPRRVERLSHCSPPKSVVNLECNHFLRTSRAESAHGQPSVEYQLWLEAGKHIPPFPKIHDSSYNSNVWRNFKSNFNRNSIDRPVSEATAMAYPIAIPKPSKVGDYTFGRFLKETPALIKDGRLREIAVSRTEVDSHVMEQLKLRTHNRHPPLDKEGK